MPYDVVADFAPVGMILEGPALILITNPIAALSSRSPELIAYGKANPGKLSFGSSGSGTVNALAIAQLGAEAGIDIVDVPYRGITQAGIAVVAGEIEGAVRVPGRGQAAGRGGQGARSRLDRRSSAIRAGRSFRPWSRAGFRNSFIRASSVSSRRRRRRRPSSPC